MRPVMIPGLALAALTLTACDDSTTYSTLRVEPLPAEVTEDCERDADGNLVCCPDPAVFLQTDDWLIIAGATGLALIECGREKGVAVDAYEGTRAALSQ